MKWFNHPACVNRVSCRDCRGSEVFRQTLVDHQKVDTRDFACPHGMDKMGLGDWVEWAVKVPAKILRLSCIDKKGGLKPESNCAKRRDKLNALTRGIL